MDKKIELIEQDGEWGWYILKWSGTDWYNSGCGVEKTYEAACTAAREAYDDNKAENKN